MAGIPSLAALLLTLETLAVKSEFQNADGSAQAARLAYLETSCEPLWRDNGEAAEAFGNAWAKTGNFNKAIEWYERAQIAPDGTASLAAIEQLANLKVRRACEEVTSSGSNRRVRFDNARREIAQAMGLLDNLLSVGATVERESLYGSAYKRLALIEAAAGRDAAELGAIAKMKDHYEAAERIARRGRIGPLCRSLLLSCDEPHCCAACAGRRDGTCGGAGFKNARPGAEDDAGSTSRFLVRSRSDGAENVCVAFRRYPEEGRRTAHRGLQRSSRTGQRAEALGFRCR